MQLGATLSPIHFDGDGDQDCSSPEKGGHDGQGDASLPIARAALDPATAPAKIEGNALLTKRSFAEPVQTGWDRLTPTIGTDGRCSY